MSTSPTKYTYEKQKSDTYYQHMDKIGELLRQRNEIDFNNTDIVEPSVEHVKDNYLLWTNFRTCCDAIWRDPQHVYYFFTDSILSHDETYVVMNNFNEKKLHDMYKKYLSTFVTCCMCKSNKTILQKDNVNKFYVLYCANCYCVIPVEKIGLYPV